MAAELKVVAMTLDGLPIVCPECGTSTFTLDGRGPIDALASVRGTCTNYHSWEDQLLTIDDLKAINAARTGREKAEDDDTFEIEIGGAVLAGILHPDVILDDLKRASDVYWKRIIKPAIRRRKNKAVRAVKRPIKNGVAGTKAAAIGAVWQAQAGGYEPDPDYQPEPVTPCAACNGKGAHDIKSRLHDTTHVRCSVCHGTGEID